MRENLKITLTAPESLKVRTQAAEPLSLRLCNAVTGISDYDRLRNKPRINGEELTGDTTSKSLHVVSENTVAGWEEHRTYVPRRGEIVIYTDYEETEDGAPVPMIKIGDGNAYVADLPFAGGDMREELLTHIRDMNKHITDEDRAFWNRKLNCELDGEELLFNRG